MPVPVSDPQVLKEQAGYHENMNNGIKRCASCRFYSDGTCEIVTGMIEPYGGCNFYQVADWVARGALQHE